MLKNVCRHFRPKRQTLLLAPYISAMPVAPVDLLLIYVGLKRRRICLLILSLFLLIIYYVTFSKSVFDFSKSRTIIIRQEHHLASQALACGGDMEGEREERREAAERTRAALLSRL